MTAGAAGHQRRKRVLDLVLATTLLVATAPAQVAVAWAVRARLGRPVLFRQQRPGLHGEPFVLVKFRTMHDGPGGPASDEERLAPLGRRLRSTSLDELPTLWNVVRGDMSLVGPRPLLMEYLGLYSPDQARRHDVRPGITGLAQVRGRNALSWEDKLAADVEYVDRWTMGLDLWILARTIGLVLRRVGVTAPRSATAPAFTGSSRTTG